VAAYTCTTTLHRENPTTPMPVAVVGSHFLHVVCVANGPARKSPEKELSIGSWDGIIVLLSIVHDINQHNIRVS
jgi:hypothetical protein